MKFKEHATEKAIYKLVGLGMFIFYLQSILLIAGAFASIILADQSDNELRIAVVFYLFGGVVVAAVGEYFRQTRAGMAIKE